MPESDADLLNAFAVHRDEAAFRVLAGRHLGLVFHAALRRTGNRPLAEEISQNVLCALAAKAGLLARHPERLPAWLHRATLYESTKAMRSETSRRRREQLADLHGETSQGAALADALPHLDPALDQLGEADRRLLLLHYYEGRSFPDIAGLLGKSTVAVQKQSQRALEKLARMLRGKGVALSAIALASVLSGEFAKAATPSLTSSVVAAALAKSGGSSTGLALFMAMKSKALIPVALLIAAVPLVLMETAISRAEQRNEALRSRSSTAVAAMRTPTAPIRGGKGISGSIDLTVLLNEAYGARRGGDEMWGALVAKLSSFDPETLRRLSLETVNCHAHSKVRGHLLNALVEAMKSDPGLAVRTVAEVLRSSNCSPMVAAYVDLPRTYGIWAWKDPEPALAWLKGEETSDLLAMKRAIDGQLVDELRAQMLWALLANKHPLGREFIGSIAESGDLPLQRVFRQAIGQSLPSDSEPKGGMDEWVTIYAGFISEFIPTVDQAKSFKALVNVLGPNDEEALVPLTTLVQDPALTPEERKEIIRHVAMMRSDVNLSPVSQEEKLVRVNETRAWLENLLPKGEAAELLEQVTRESQQANPEEGE